MSSKLPSQKMADTSKDELLLGGGINGGHFERRAAIGRRNKPHHNYIVQK